jgi:uncharacterized protein YpmB
MNIKRTRNWLLSAAIALGAAGFGTTATFAQERDHEKEVRMADVPRDAREAIDKERGNREIRKIEHVYRNGNEWYRATVDDRGNKSTEIRVTPTGKTLSEQQIRDFETRRGNDNDRRTTRDNDRRDDRSDEKQIRLGGLPREAREVVDKERGRNEVKAVYEVRRGDRTFYRVIIDDRNGDRMLRVSENGKLLEESDIREVRTAGANVGGGVRRGVDDDGDHVSFERLPGEVKTVIAREAGSDKVGDVYRYERRGRTIYEADLNSGTRTRVIKVDENGRILSEKDDTPEGRRSVQFSELPGAVKSGLASEVNERDITRVVQVTRDGKTFYRARVEKGGEPRWVTVDERGRVSDEFNPRR